MFLWLYQMYIFLRLFPFGSIRLLMLFDRLTRGAYAVYNHVIRSSVCHRSFEK
jgi:hypothetical protein